MTPAAMRDQYRRQIEVHGEMVTLRRVGSPNVEKQVRARVTGYTPEELISGIDQGSRKVILLAEDVEASAFPVPFKTGGSDKVLARGKVLNVDDVDDSTRRIAGVLIAYELRVSGA